MLPTTDRDHLRRAIAVARSARDHGNQPFGAVLVGPDGRIALEAENTVITSNDVTGHAEINLVRLGWAALAHPHLPLCTLYSSCEPCAMCAGAIYWSGIGRVVYALAESTLFTLAGESSFHLSHPCRLVFAGGGRATDVSGPHLEDEAAVPHRGYWT
nr:nucleoside deaminase [Propionicimonas sp.]